MLLRNEEGIFSCFDSQIFTVDKSRGRKLRNRLNKREKAKSATSILFKTNKRSKFRISFTLTTFINIMENKFTKILAFEQTHFATDYQIDVKNSGI